MAGSDGPKRVWRWRITRQLELSPGYAAGQMAALSVGFVILIFLWLPPNEGAFTLLIQVFITAIWLWAVQFLLGPYRATAQR